MWNDCCRGKGIAYALSLVIKKKRCIGVETNQDSRDRQHELMGKWSDDAVGRGILGKRGKGVFLIFFHSFIFCDCESLLRCDAERKCVSS